MSADIILKRKIESGELTTLLAVVHEYCQLTLKSSPVYDEQFDNGIFSYSLHCANTPRYFGHHEHKKQAKLMAARDFLRNEAVDILDWFERVSNQNGRKSSTSHTRTMPVTNFGFGKTIKARNSSALAPHPYARPSPPAFSDPLADPQRRSVATYRVLGEIDRGEVITPCDAFESLQEGLGLPRAIVTCSQVGNRCWSIMIDDGNRIYGQAQHALKRQAKLLAYEDAVRSAAPGLWSRLRSTEFDSYKCSVRQYVCNEDVLHEYVSRNFRTSVSFHVEKNEREEIFMQARVYDVVIGSGCDKNLKTARSEAIRQAVADLCPHLMGLLHPSDPRLHPSHETDQLIYPLTSSSPQPYYPVPPERTITPSYSPLPLACLPTPPVPSATNHGPRVPSDNLHRRDQLIKPMDFGLSPAVRMLMERIDQGSITTLSALFAAYFQLVDRTTASYDIKAQQNGSFRCDIIINGKSVGSGESGVKRHAKLIAIRNVMQSFCPVLLERLTCRYPTLIPE